MTGDRKPRQIKKILCPTDFSEESDAAVRYSAELTTAFGAKIYVCHQRSHPWWKLNESPKTDIENLYKNTEALIEGIDRNLDWQNVFIDAASNTARCITAFAGEMKSDLIVMSAKHSLFSAPLFGSTIESVIAAPVRC